MKIKHLASAFLLATGLAFAAPALGAQLGLADTVATVSAANEGWNTDANGTFYIKDGSRLTGMQTIGGSSYYFSRLPRKRLGKDRRYYLLLQAV